MPSSHDPYSVSPPTAAPVESGSWGYGGPGIRTSSQTRLRLGAVAAVMSVSRPLKDVPAEFPPVWVQSPAEPYAAEAPPQHCKQHEK